MAGRTVKCGSWLGRVTANSSTARPALPFGQLRATRCLSPVWPNAANLALVASGRRVRPQARRLAPRMLSPARECRMRSPSWHRTRRARLEVAPGAGRPVRSALQLAGIGGGAVLNSTSGATGVGRLSQRAPRSECPSKPEGAGQQATSEAGEPAAEGPSQLRRARATSLPRKGLPDSGCPPARQPSLEPGRWAPKTACKEVLGAQLPTAVSRMEGL